MINTSNVNFNFLRDFVIAAESKNLSEVARKTGYSESNISTNLSKLEKQLGVKLLKRKPLKTTEIGQEIYEKLKNGFTDLDIAIQIAESKNSLEFGKINIGCPSHIADFFLISRISKATNDYPNLQIILDTESGSTELINSLKNNKIDFAILDVIPENYINELEIKEVRKSENIFIAKERIEIKNIQELNNYKYILPYDDRLSSIRLKDKLSKYNIELKSRLTCPTTEQRINAAKYGIGIAYVMKEAAKRAINDKEVYEVDMPIKLPTSSLKVVCLKDHLGKIDKQFINTYLK